MKLIIDIQDDVYKKIIADKYAIYDKMYYSIKNGTPLNDMLDRITTTIEKYKDDRGKPEDVGYFSEVNQSTIGAYEICLRIINYWRNEVSS